MNIKPIENRKEIAEQLDCGFRAYINKITGQLLFVPDDNNYPDIDIDLWNEDLEQLDNNFSEYLEIVKWTSSEAFKIMCEFTDQLTEINLQSLLFEALRKNKPLREFKIVIDNSGDYRHQWFDFKNNWQQDFVAKQLNLLETKDE